MSLFIKPLVASRGKALVPVGRLQNRFRTIGSHDLYIQYQQRDLIEVGKLFASRMKLLLSLGNFGNLTRGEIDAREEVKQTRFLSAEEETKVVQNIFADSSFFQLNRFISDIQDPITRSNSSKAERFFYVGDAYRTALLKQANSHSEQEKSHLDQAYSHCERENIHLEQRNSHFEQANIHLEQATSQLKRANSHSEQANSYLKQANSHSEQEKIHLEQSNSHLKQANIHLKQANIHLKLKNMHWEQAKRHLKQKNIHSEQANSHLEQRNSHLEQRNSHLEQANSHSEQANSHSEQANIHRQRHDKYLELIEDAYKWLGDKERYRVNQEQRDPSLKSSLGIFFYSLYTYIKGSFG